ncbi:MAG: hypothetical protein ABIG84_05825 [archaeon]
MGIKNIKIDYNGVGPYNSNIVYNDGFSLDLCRNKIMNNGHTMSSEVEAFFYLNSEAIGRLDVFKNFKGLSRDSAENTIPEEYRSSVTSHLDELQNNTKVKENGTFGKPFFLLLESVSTLMEYYQSEKSRPAVKSRPGGFHETYEF